MSRMVTFGSYEWNPHTRELRGERGSTLLQDKPHALLKALTDRPDDVVTREELHAALWPADLHVERDAGLNTAMRKLRAALRDVDEDGDDPIETVPRLGYRLRGPVSSTTAAAGRPMRFVAGITLAAAATVVVAAVVSTPAVSDSGTAPALDPLSRAEFIEARALMSQGDDLRRAAQLLATVSDRAPDFIDARAYRAEALALLAFRGSDRVAAADAGRVAREVLTGGTRHHVAERALALVEIHFDGRASAAEPRLIGALELAPDDPVNHVAIASLRSIQGRHDEAILHIERAVDLAPETMTIRADAGYFLLRAGRFADAVAACEMVLRIDPGDGFARRCLARAHHEMGNRETSREQALELLRAEGASATALQALAESPRPYREYMDWTLEQLLAAPTGSALAIATAYAELGQLAEAARWLQRAVDAAEPMLPYAAADDRLAALAAEPRFRKVFGT